MPYSEFACSALASGLDQAISTLDLSGDIHIATVTGYPTIRPDIKVESCDGIEIPVQIDSTQTHFIYTFCSRDFKENETVARTLGRTFGAICDYLLEPQRKALREAQNYSVWLRKVQSRFFTVSYRPLSSCYLCVITAPYGNSVTGLKHAISTLDLRYDIPIATVTDYPTIRPDLDVEVGDMSWIPIQIDSNSSQTQSTYTFLSRNIDNDETASRTLGRTFTAIYMYLSESSNTLNQAFLCEFFGFAATQTPMMRLCN